MSERKIRVLMAKPGLDGHEIGAVTVASGIRDAGMEVVYTGLFQTPEKIVTAAIQEDVDVIGCSICSGAHLVLMRKINELIKERVRGDKKFLVLVGGPIVPNDIPKLKEIGVDEVFSSRSKIEDVVEFIKEHASR